MTHDISLPEAIDLTTRYRNNKNNLLATGVPADTLPLSETFSNEDINALLAQSNCEAVRIYYGLDEEDKLHAVLVGVDANDDDIANKSSVILEKAIRCPTSCPPASVLNS